MSAPSYDLPASDVLEISLFGPSFGECLVVHYGDGRWFTVDSCLEEDETPSALAYFSALGVDPTVSVTHTIMTHADGDHVGGIAELYRACSASRFVCPAVLADRELGAYIASFASGDPAELTQYATEVFEALELAFERPPHESPQYVLQDTPILKTPTGTMLTAIAPSSSKMKDFLGRVAKLTAKAGDDKRARVLLAPNAVSAALLLQTSTASFVLGADLEEVPGQGWTTVLRDSIAYAGAGIPLLYKVAHHGSEGAHSDALWSSMRSPLAILAPFKNGRHRLPTKDQVDRILKLTRQAFSTASYRTMPIRKLSRADRMAFGQGIRRRSLGPEVGHIRVRVTSSGNVTHDLFGGAVHLSRVH